MAQFWHLSLELMIRLLVADDHPVVRGGVRLMLRHQADIRVSAEAGTLAETIVAIERGGFDAILLDLTFPDGSGLDLLSMLMERNPRVPVIVFTGAVDAVNRCVSAGATAFLSKEAGLDELRSAIVAAMSGRRFIGARVARFLTKDESGVEPPETEPPHVRLSPRELDIMLKLVRGRRAKEIACELDISEKTVATHRARLMKKLNVTDTRELLFYALRVGLTDWR